MSLLFRERMMNPIHSGIICQRGLQLGQCGSNGGHVALDQLEFVPDGMLDIIYHSLDPFLETSDESPSFPWLDDGDRTEKDDQVDQQDDQTPVRADASDLVTPHLLFVIPFENTLEQCRKRLVDLGFRALQGFLARSHRMVEGVIRPNELRKPGNIGVGPVVFPFEQGIQVTLGHAAGRHGLVVGVFCLRGFLPKPCDIVFCDPPLATDRSVTVQRRTHPAPSRPASNAQSHYTPSPR